MRSPVKIILLVALLSCAAIGLRHVRGQSGHESNQGSVTVAAANRRSLEDSTIHVNGGSFALKNLTLTKMTGSTVLNGKIVNKTNHNHEQVSFEVRAYDRDGRMLKGTEAKTIFLGQELKANASMPINHGYGVWLQGIHVESIMRLDVVETSNETSSLPSWTKWLASHAISWEEDSEIEE